MENKKIETGEGKIENSKENKVETVEDLERQIAEATAKLEKLRDESKQNTEKNILKIDNTLSEFDIKENEETLLTKEQINEIDKEKQEAIDSGVSEINKGISFETKENQSNKEEMTHTIMNELKQEELENDNQKKIEDAFFEKQKSVNRETAYNIKKTMTDREELENASGKMLNDIFEYDSGVENINPEKSDNKKEPIKEQVINQTEGAKDNNTEITGNEKGPGQKELTPEEMSKVVSSNNKAKFERMPKKSKNFMSRIYSGLIKLPANSRTIGKIQIAYNQFLFDKKEKQRLNLKRKLEGLDIKSQALYEKNKLNEDMVEYLKDIDSNIQTRVTKEKEKDARLQEKIDNKTDKIALKIQQKEIALGIFKNRRDAIVDRFITNYDMKISPLEGKLNTLEKKKKEMEEIETKAENLISIAQIKITVLENKRNETIEKLSASYSEKEIDKNEIVKSLNESINYLYLNIQAKRAEIAKAKDKIDMQINKKVKKISPYILKRDALFRIKSRGIIDFDNIKEEPVSTSETEGKSKEKSFEKNEEEITFKNIDTLNNMFENYKKLTKKEEIDSSLIITIDEFTKISRASEKNNMKKDNFKEILKTIYRIKEIPENKYINIIDKI